MGRKAEVESGARRLEVELELRDSCTKAELTTEKPKEDLSNTLETLEEPQG